jgi:hypothetical protein
MKREMFYLVSFGLITACAKTGVPSAPESADVQTSESDSEEAQTGPTVKQILDRYVEVTGGEAAYASHSNQLAQGYIDIAAQGLRGPVSLYMESPNSKMMVMEIPGMGQIVRVFDGDIGWEINPMLGPRLLTEDELKVEEHDAAFNAALAWDTLYPERELKGASEFRGEEVWEILLVSSGGMERTSYFSQESGLMIGMDMTVPTDMGDVPVEVRMEDYQMMDDILVPMRSVQAMGPIEVVVQLESLVWDVEEGMDLSMPDEVRALIPQPEEPATGE